MLQGPISVVVNGIAMVQAIDFGVNCSHEQNAKHEAAPGWKAHITALDHRIIDDFGFVFYFVCLGEHILWLINWSSVSVMQNEDLLYS